jgi:cell division protease FtsH
MSDETAKLIDEEVRRLVEGGETEARRIIHDYADRFEAIAQALLEFETLTGDELRDLMNGNPPKRGNPEDTSAQPPRGSAVPSTGTKPTDLPGGAEPQPT